LIGDRIFFNNDKFAIDINGEVCKPTIKEDVCKCIFFYKHKEKWVRFECLLCGIENATDEKVESIKQFAKGFFIKESEKSMITDKQGEKWLLKKIYDDGWRYIVADKYDNMYLTNEKPPMFDDVDEVRISSCKKYIGITGVMAALPKLSANEVFSIEEELGIVDWRNVAVDTPVLVSVNGVKWYKRYFAKADYCDVYVWNKGATSWSIENVNDTEVWNHIKLAEV
jgi:hypothetical protein